MGNRIEVEEKYFFYDIDKLKEIIEENKFNLVSNFSESDEYFTDIDSKYIENRTCLRLRKSLDNVELTFKGKSNEFLNSYSKVEKNIDIGIDQYNDMTDLLNKLGYYSYVIVEKERMTYTKTLNNLVYNIMVDKIENVGNFVEFEILCEDLNYDVKILNNKLKEFVSLFKKLNLQVANLPYRDFVANRVLSNVKPSKPLTSVFFDLDGTLINSENVFFESFKEVLKEKFDVNIEFYEYEENELSKNSNLVNYLKENNKIPDYIEEDIIINEVYEKYSSKFNEVLKDDTVYLNFKLLQKLKEKGLKIGLVSTSKRKFIDLILSYLNKENLFEIIIAREDVEELKPSPEAYIKALEAFKIKNDECIAIEDSNRGIESAIKAGIKTIRINEYYDNNLENNIVTFDKLSRLLLILINNV